MATSTPHGSAAADHLEMLALFHSICDGVAAVLAANTDWGASGLRADQYQVDLAADEVCTEALRAAGLTVLSEESGLTGPDGRPVAPDTVDGSRVVVVDPLDGSTNASRRIPWYATALCLVEPDPAGSVMVPTVAMVANHATGQRHTAVRGNGAALDGVPIAVSGCREMSECMLGVNGLPRRHFGWAQFRAMGAAAPDLCSVASGVIDAWCDMTAAGHGVWDYLGALLVCWEAGASSAEVLDRDLVVLDPGERRIPVVAASPELLETLLGLRRAEVR